MDQFAIALFLAAVNKALVDYISAPLKKRRPDLDFWWLVYVAGVSGLLLGWFSTINLFAAYIPDPFVGRLLTAILVGGGSSLIHDIFDRPQVVELPSTVRVEEMTGDVNVEPSLESPNAE